MVKLPTDVNIHILKESIRGGIAVLTCHYAETSDKYMLNIGQTKKMFVY